MNTNTHARTHARTHVRTQKNYSFSVFHIFMQTACDHNMTAVILNGLTLRIFVSDVCVCMFCVCEVIDHLVGYRKNSRCLFLRS